MTVYQLRAEYEATKKEGAIVDSSPPSFPHIEGWTLVKILLDGQRSSLVFEGSEKVAQAMDVLFYALEEAAKRGEIEIGYDVTLFADDAAEAVTPPTVTAPVADAGPTGPPASSTRSKKGRWAGLF